MAIDENSEIENSEWIDAQTKKCSPITRTDLRHYCEVKYSISISQGGPDSFILRHRDNVAETKVHLKKRRDWKYHVLSWTKQDVLCEKKSKE
jgi:hypothetical protein